ncbi:MurR/RpiR family transcriptional regulator [uncultured Thomasclavelia sp.]|uniref:MurR/RpiR family transcriptional regulator n=1 Tax=uncultured Thomasclavelia sp. TaxID=3025759 RepID=UPI0025CFC0DA|nr:hypothetical protein [uncultured Thomasclavelia sp.]
MYLLEKLELLVDNLELEKIDYKIAKYILYHQDEVLKDTVRQLAKKTYVSPSAIIRFVNKMGYRDYNHFKEALAYEIENEKAKSEEAKDIKQLTYKQYFSKLEASFNQVYQNSLSDLDKLILLLKNNDEIIFYLEPGYHDIFLPLMNRLRKLGKEVKDITYKSEVNKIDIIKERENNSVIIMFFPSDDYSIVYMRHVQMYSKFIYELEHNDIPKFFIGQDARSFYGFDDNLVLPYLKDKSMYKIIMILLIDYLISKL